jgi:hypothetical protein
MIENNRALSVARASGLGTFKTRDYGPKAASVNAGGHTVAAMPSGLRIDARKPVANIHRWCG